MLIAGAENFVSLYIIKSLRMLSRLGIFSTPLFSGSDI
jgi:hypothetical protein